MDKNTDKDISEALKTLGLSKSEHEVFMILIYFRSKGVNAHFVANDLEIPRPTAYSILNNIVKKGLASKKKCDGVFLFYTDNEVMEDYVSSRYESMEKAKEQILLYHSRL